MLRRLLITSVLAVMMITAAAAGSETDLPPKSENIAITTAAGIKTAGEIPVYEPNGDAVRATVVVYPQKGELVFSGTQYTYTPFAGETGKDSFQYLFLDAAGNAGNVARAEVTIEPQAAQTYADMQNNPSHFSAIKLLEHGIAAGEQVGGRYYFHPNRAITRGEYLLLLLSARGETAFAACVNTGLKNDSDIPSYLKPAVKYALEQKLLRGDRFYPDKTLTRAQAVVLTSRAAGMPKVEAYNLKCADRGQIPAFATQAYLNLAAYKMLDLYDGKAHPNRRLTRAVAADLCWQLYKLKQQN